MANWIRSVAWSMRRKRHLKKKQVQMQEWSIGIYLGTSPFDFRPHPSVSNPVLTRNDVTDRRALFVADPFMIRVSEKWFMFFEVWDDDSNHGQIGLATSTDALRWKYESIVLKEPFHLSYPYVFEWQDQIYMVPESFESRSVRLYRAVRFPTQWQHVSTLLTGPFLVDSSPFYFQNRWWLFAETNAESRWDTLRLYSAKNLLGTWSEHPASPVVAGDPHSARPAGRTLVVNGKIIRYAQDCYPIYGTRVRAFEIVELTSERYKEQPIGREILAGSNDGWNSSGMHQIDPHPANDGEWIACVDGWRPPADPIIQERNSGKITYTSSVASTPKARAFEAMRGIKWSLVNAVGTAPCDPRRIICSLAPRGNPKGNTLLFHLNQSFLLTAGEPILNSHSNCWETLQIARVLLDLGYSVDVVHHLNSDFMPQKDYSVVVDVRRNLERIAPLLHKDCIKIMHGDTAHILFHNAAEANRLLALQQRRGVTLKPRRWEVPTLGIEHADYATILGNEVTLGTYRYAKKPLYRLYVPSPVTYPAPTKNVDKSRKSFIWFGSGGLVHKGVDLLLEAFAGMPELELVLCGPVLEETDFAEAYRRELLETPNIRVMGWLDVESTEFQSIVNNCIALVYPSCSEGQAGSVVTCLHAGVIPVVSAESGVDVEGFGMMLPSCSIFDIQRCVRTVAQLPAAELQMRVQSSWETARALYTRDRYATRYRKIMEEILSGNGLAT